MNTHKIAMKMQDKRLCQILNITLKELKYRRENGLIGL